MTRPILFSAPMVAAILAGQKTMTRRLVKFDKPFDKSSDWPFMRLCTDGNPCFMTEDPAKSTIPESYFDVGFKCPFGAPGDRLWVREAWRTSKCEDGKKGSELEIPGGGYGWPVWYGADGGAVTWRGASDGGPGFVNPGRYRHGRFMPRWASRITLEIVSIRVERLNEISEADAKAEGIKEPVAAHGEWCDPALGREGHWSYRKPFADLWTSLHGPGTFDGRWVWVVEFRRLAGAA